MCAGEHGAVRVPGGGERGVGGRRFEAQPAALLQRRTGLDYPAAQLGARRRGEQVGGAAAAVAS